MGIRAIVEALRAAVSATAPKTWSGDSFTCPREGVVLEPSDWLEHWGRRTREFDVIVAEFPAPSPGCHLVAGLEIVVLYRLDQDQDLLMTAIAEDVGLLRQSIQQTPSTWGGAVSVYQQAQPEIEEIEAPGGLPAIVVLRLPLTIYYDEEPVT